MSSTGDPFAGYAGSGFTVPGPFGGGIDVIPKTHNAFKHFGGLKIPRFLYQKFSRSIYLATKRLSKIIK